MAEEGHLHQEVRHAGLPPAVAPCWRRDSAIAALRRPRSSSLSSSWRTRREVAGRPLVKDRRIQRRAAALVRRVDIRAVSDEHFDGFLVAQEGRRVEGRPAVPADGVHIRASLDEQLDGLCLTGDRRPQQRRPAAFGVHGVHRHAARQVPLDGVQITRSRGRPDVRRSSTPGPRRRLPGADDIARVEIPIVSGTIVNIPTSNGRNTRWNRCLTSAPRPRLWSNIALK